MSMELGGHKSGEYNLLISYFQLQAHLHVYSNGADACKECSLCLLAWYPIFLAKCIGGTDTESRNAFP